MPGGITAVVTHLSGHMYCTSDGRSVRKWEPSCALGSVYSDYPGTVPGATALYPIVTCSGSIIYSPDRHSWIMRGTGLLTGPERARWVYQHAFVRHAQIFVAETAH